MKEQSRVLGLDVLPAAPWGTHLCQFYETKEDLIDTLVPYFKAGLENNEFCMWVTAEPLGVEDAKAALWEAVKNLDDYIDKGQIEILDYSQWYTRSGKFHTDEVLQGWVEKLNQALDRGFDGLRLTGNSFWLEKKDWDDFAAYEAAVDNVIGKYRMLSICSYALDKCGSHELIDVAQNHEFAIIRRHGKWEIFESTGRKRAEESLRLEKDFSQLIIDSSIDGILTFDRDCRYTTWNSGMERISGITKEQCIGRVAFEVFPFLKETGEDKLFYQALKGRSSVATDSFYKVPETGREGWFNGYYSPLRNQSDEVIGGLAIIRDISERKLEELELEKAYEKLEQRVEQRTLEVVTANKVFRQEIEARRLSEKASMESQKRYKELWDNAPVAYHMLDAAGIITHVNKTETKMFGYTTEEMIGKPIFEFILPEQRKEAQERFQRKIAGEKVPRDDSRMYQRKDGSKIYVSIDDVLEYGSDGKVLSVRTTMVDVTERKQAEQALLRVNRALIVLSNCGEALIRAGDESEFMNTICEILVVDGGYRLAWVGLAEQDQAKTVRPVAQKGFEHGYVDTVNISWADNERGRGPTGTAIRTKKPSIARNIMTDAHFAPWREAAGKRGYASSLALPLIAEGRSIGAINIYAGEPDAFDAEEVKLLSSLADDLSYGLLSLRARAELRRLSSRLLEVQENERSRIARELHDSIGQSLTAIKFGLENTLSRSSKDIAKESAELLEALIPVVQQASEEVRQIHTDLRPSLLDDLGIMATISWFCRELEKVYSGIKIEKQMDMEEKEVPEPLKIVVFRVLQEAVNNVAKHSKADLVRVFLKRRNGKLELVVEDNGQGFDVEHVSLVRSPQKGFGLTSMKERTELSGGAFAIESTPGVGTVVRASWPV
jgi:PAS domain S-box-containing protein